jgi:acetyl esterase/lipase
MRKKTILSAIVLGAIMSNLFAQTKVIDVWSGKVPNSIYNPGVKSVVDSADNWIKRKHVTNPTLEMYAPEKTNANGKAVIICPGGGYSALAIIHEGSQTAKWLNSLGVTAFVLNYRLPDDAIMDDKSIAPLQDAQEAIRIVRLHAKEWNINPGKIGIMGFSAGGHVAATLATHFNDKVYQTNDSVSARPDFSILIYPVITMDSAITNTWSRRNLIGNNPSEKDVLYFSNELHVTENTPPAFLVHSIDDDAVPVQNSINYAMALHKYTIPCELHIYQSGKHGYGMGRTSNTESSWTEACKKWLLMNRF